MNNVVKLGLLGAFAFGLAALFMFIDIGSHWDYVLPRRGKKLLAIALMGGAIAFSTIIFMTITNNRILTPSVIGLDSLYMLIQTFVVFVFGSTSAFVLNKNYNFLLCVAMMILFSSVLFKALFRREGRNIYFLLLVGIIFGTFFQSISSFMQVLIDPNEFLIVQNKMFASFNNVNTDLLALSSVAFAVVAAYFMRFAKYLDVLALGKEEAVNLGVEYDYVVKRMLIVIAVLISIATALVGPITFLGLLVANLAYQMFQTYRHSILIPGTMLLSAIALVGGQLIVERVFTFNTTVSVIINFVGGVYFIYLLLKENKAW